MLSVSELRRERSEISAGGREGAEVLPGKCFCLEMLKCGDQTSWQGWSRGAWRRRDFPCCSVVVAPLQGRNEHGLGSELPKNKVP